MSFLSPTLDKTIENIKFKLEDYGYRLQIDLIYILKNEFWIYLRQTVTLITGLAISVAFARLTTKELYGQYNFILAAISIISIVSLPGLNNSVLRSVARGCEGVYRPAVKRSFLFSLIGLPVLAGMGLYQYYQGNQAIGICLMISSIFFPFLNAPNTWEGFLQGKKRFDVSAKYASLQAITNALTMAVALLLYPKNLIYLFFAYLLSNAFTTYLIYNLSLNYIENNIQDEEWLRYGYFLTSTNIVGIIANNIDKILIGALLGTQEVAVYVIATTIPIKIKDLLKLTWTPLTPKFCQDEMHIGLALNRLRKFAAFAIFFFAATGILYWMLIDDAIILFYGEKYADAAIHSRILIFMILASIPNVFLGTFAIAKGNKRAIVAGYHILPFIKLLMMITFIYLWGLIGAMWALNLSVLAQILLLGTGILRKGRRPL